MRIRVVGGPYGGQWIEVANDLADFEVEASDGKRTRYMRRFWTNEYPAPTAIPSEVAFFIPQHMSDAEAAELVMADPEAREQLVEDGQAPTA